MSGEVHPGPQYFGGGRNRADVRHGPRHQIHPLERFPVAAKRKLAVGAVSREIVDLARQPGIRHRLEIEYRSQFIEAGHAAVIAKRIQLGSEKWRTCQKTRHGPNRAAAVQAFSPGAFDLIHTTLPGSSLPEKEYHNRPFAQGLAGCRFSSKIGHSAAFPVRESEGR